MRNQERLAIDFHRPGFLLRSLLGSSLLDGFPWFALAPCGRSGNDRIWRKLWTMAASAALALEYLRQETACSVRDRDDGKALAFSCQSASAPR